MIDRYCLNPAIWSSAARPSAGRRRNPPEAGNHQRQRQQREDQRQIPSAPERHAEDRHAKREGDRDGREADQGSAGTCRRRTRGTAATGCRDRARAPSDDADPPDFAAVGASTTADAVSHSAAMNISSAGGRPNRNCAGTCLAFKPLLQNLAQGILRRRELGVILLLHDDVFARLAQAVERGFLLVRRQRRRAVAGARSASFAREDQPPSSSTRRMWPLTPMSTSAAAKARLSAPILVT